MNISVVIRANDREVLLERALISLANQTRKPYEVIIVNNGKHHQLDQLVMPFREHLRIVLLYPRKQLSLGAALNFGIHGSSGDWIGILDDDDTWEPDFLKIHEEMYYSQPTFEGFACLTNRIDEIMEGEVPVFKEKKIFKSTFENRLVSSDVS